MSSQARNHSRIASALTMEGAFIPCQPFAGDAIATRHTTAVAAVFRLEIGQKNILTIRHARVEREGAGGLGDTIGIQIVVNEPHSRKVVV